MQELLPNSNDNNFLLGCLIESRNISSGLDVQHVYFSSIYSSLSLMFVTNVPPCQEMYVENCFVRLSYDIDVPSLTMVLN